MKSILAVDDSRAIRAIVAKKVHEMGHEVQEAGDGEEGLLRLAERRFDLVILDVTMPILDGPGMLKRMRERGDKTPVLMLTSESKRSIMVDVMKLGIEDYILKPFKPEQLNAKIEKIVGASAPAPAPAPAPVPVTSKAPVDVLIVDDMENVHKRLRTILPAHLSMHGTTSAEGALSLAEERVYSVVLVDTDIPDVKSHALMQQLRLLQPQAAMLALALRSAGPSANDKGDIEGSDGVLQKPFETAAIEELVSRFFAQQELRLGTDHAAIAPRQGSSERYHRRLAAQFPALLDKFADAAFGEVVADATQMTLDPERTPVLFAEVDRQAKHKGLILRLVGTAELHSLLRQSPDTAGIEFHGSLAEARSAA